MSKTKQPVGWPTPELKTRQDEKNLMKWIDEQAALAVDEAIADHKAAGNPIYYRDPKRSEHLIKEYADGRAVAVQVDENGGERELGPVK